MTRFARIVRGAGAAAGIAALAVGASELGWLRSVRPWQAATGWNEIPLAERPALGVVAALDAEEAPELLWLGHSGFVLRWNGQTILLDPNTAGRCTVSRRVLERSFDLSTLGPVDAVLISHAHADHLDLPTLRALERIGTLVAPPGSADYFDEQIRSVHRLWLAVGETSSIGPITIAAVPAAHNGNRLHPFASAGHPAVGYVLRSGGTTLYYAGDTGPSNDFAAIRERWHPTLAILPIGAFSPRFPIGLYHLSPEDAVRAAQVLGVTAVVPCHFGTWRLSLDRPDTALPRFARAAASHGLRWIMPQLATSAPPLPDATLIAGGVRP